MIYKQRMSQQDWANTRERSRAISKQQILDKVEQTATALHKVLHNYRIGPDAVCFGWSGGKESMVVEYICKQLGIMNCVLSISQLEYPSFLKWVTDNMPLGLTVQNRGYDLQWLANNQQYLFPQDYNTNRRWVVKIQNSGLRKYLLSNKQYRAALLGRRKADGNNIEQHSLYIDNHLTVVKTQDNVLRINMIAYWSHEEVFALMDHMALPYAPFYTMPRGFQVGTHSWPVRQWTKNIQHGWEEVYAIDPKIVIAAAKYFPSAATFLGDY